MSAFVSYFLATIISIPLLGYIVIFVITKQITKQHRRAVQMAIDGSTFLFIISVHFLIVTIWERSLLWVIILFILSVGVLVVLLHWKLKEEIDYQKVFRGFWRMNFLLFFSAYTILIIIGIVRSITNAVS